MQERGGTGDVVLLFLLAGRTGSFIARDKLLFSLPPTLSLDEWYR